MKADQQSEVPKWLAVDPTHRATETVPAADSASDRCSHGVWKGDYCYWCNPSTVSEVSR
jgi:hypothetical protein